MEKITSKLNEKQKELIIHALGLDRVKKPYRNRYVTYGDDSEWEKLVNQGFAKKQYSRSLGKDGVFYWVTLEGMKQIGLKAQCSILGCNNNFYKNDNINEVTKLPYCRRHYNENNK